MFLGYNTNGLAHHDPLQAIDLLAELGYQGVGLTIDHGLLNPYLPAAEHKAAIDAMAERLAATGLRSVIETGARFLLDPRRKHEPTLVSPTAADRAGRVQFLGHAIRLAARLGSDCVSFWSGIVHDGASSPVAYTRLVEGLKPVLDLADQHGVILAFEPEPGMLVDTMEAYDRLLSQIDAPHFQLTLDLGHLHCQGETPIADYIARYQGKLANVHLEDMRAGVHEHLMFGEGEIAFAPVLAALRQADYRAGVYVELSRHSHMGPTAAARAIEFLRPLLQNTTQSLA
ncbi:sugar phosphate isomerase/epimerase family protein [Lignipirellula cremea]|uniref:L-ribulose-5-phosphate 3-epimerase UlaE n=1 Tax=Lignipirellula cremea TaxID=2528010 RepID=A0A518DZS4_9BACT|nr:sugar phosphate isomerase/epimerase family protein [Lignipirellula cremea]QDU97338.1 L-ribulose-5-phosphate 3-epimerase UlaE [Lignipirellula cremea]